MERKHPGLLSSSQNVGKRSRFILDRGIENTTNVKHVVATWTDPVDLYHESLGHRASLHPSTWPSHKAVAAPEAGSTAGGCELCSETRGVFPKCQALLTTAEHRPGASPSEAYGAFTKCPLVARCRLEAGGQG